MEAYITLILSLANGALNCSIVGLALPRGCPCGPAGFAVLLADLENCLVDCLGALALSLEKRRDDVFILYMSFNERFIVGVEGQ